MGGVYTVYRVSLPNNVGYAALHLRGDDGWDIEYAVKFANATPNHMTGRARLSIAQQQGEPVTPDLIAACVQEFGSWRRWERNPSWQNGPVPLLGSVTVVRDPTLSWAPENLTRGGRKLTFDDEDI